ncbi:MAG TPA: lipase family protein [Frankiaceae bacterium]|nr:lipase family protein [Frankiaceae bacterium]
MAVLRTGRTLRMLGAGTVAGAVVSVLLAGTGSASSADTGRGPALRLHAGELLTAQPLTGSPALPSAAGTDLITYVSDDAHGKPIVVSGTVSVPKGKAPPGGWPVISWAHGTSGYADICAPSNDTADGPDHDYFAVIDPTLDAWVARGYAVVQTDYEGLGTPGGHPYLNGISESNTVVDIVRAGRELDRHIGRNWIAMGHSQGAQAALFAAQLGNKRAPELRLRGAVPIAPGGSGIAQLVPYIASGQPGAEAAEAFLPIILLGAQAADPAIDPATLLSDAALPSLTAARTGCLAQLRAVPPVPGPSVFRAGADVGPLTTYLAQQDPNTTDPKVPTLIAQGTADTLVAKPATDALVANLCSKGASIDYKVYAGQDHRGSVGASLADAEQFVDTVITGRKAPTTC